MSGDFLGKYILMLFYVHYFIVSLQIYDVLDIVAVLLSLYSHSFGLMFSLFTSLIVDCFEVFISLGRLDD